MPRFYVYTGDGRCDVCQLQSNQCSYIKDDGSRCRNKVVQTNPYCWIHTLQLFDIRVKESTVLPGQKGLFAERDFQTGEYICPYYGSILRKNNNVATQPYAVSFRNDYTVDADCYRSAGANANSATGMRAQNNAELTDAYQDPQVRFGDRLNLPDYEHLLNPAPPRNRNFYYVALRATSRIRRGQEILLDYGDAYQFEDDHVNTPYMRTEEQAANRYCNIEPEPEPDQQDIEVYAYYGPNGSQRAENRSFFKDIAIRVPGNILDQIVDIFLTNNRQGSQYSRCSFEEYFRPEAADSEQRVVLFAIMNRMPVAMMRVSHHGNEARRIGKYKRGEGRTVDTNLVAVNFFCADYRNFSGGGTYLYNVLYNYLRDNRMPSEIELQSVEEAKPFYRRLNMRPVGPALIGRFQAIVGQDIPPQSEVRQRTDAEIRDFREREN